MITAESVFEKEINGIILNVELKTCEPSEKGNFVKIIRLDNNASLEFYTGCKADTVLWIKCLMDFL